jgi:dipeptide/tripeptide permease
MRGESQRKSTSKKFLKSYVLLFFSIWLCVSKEQFLLQIVRYCFVFVFLIFERRRKVFKEEKEGLLVICILFIMYISGWVVDLRSSVCI